MLTIRLSNYTDEEKQALCDLLTEAKIMLDTAYCPNTDCRVCRFRNVCYDVEKASNYMARKVQK